MSETPEKNDLPAKREPPEEGGSPAKLPTRELIERFIQAQSRDFEIRRQELDQNLEIRREELALKRQELDLRQQESTQGYDFARKSLEVQSQDLKTVRVQESKDSRYIVVIILSALVIITAFLCYALYYDKEQFVLELAKLVIAAVGGGGVGYAVGNRKAKKEQEEEEDK